MRLEQGDPVRLCKTRSFGLIIEDVELAPGKAGRSGEHPQRQHGLVDLAIERQAQRTGRFLHAQVDGLLLGAIIGIEAGRRDHEGRKNENEYQPPQNLAQGRARSVGHRARRPLPCSGCPRFHGANPRPEPA